MIVNRNHGYVDRNIGPYYISKLELKLNSSEILPVITSLTVNLLQLKLKKLIPVLEILKSDFSSQKKGMNTDRFAINWQIFARVRLQFKFAFIIITAHRPIGSGAVLIGGLYWIQKIFKIFLFILILFFSSLRMLPENP